MAVLVLLKVQLVSLAQFRVESVLVPNSVSKLPFITGTVAAEASGALSPMAAMAKPKNRRMGRELMAGFVWLVRHVVFMVFWVLYSGFCFFVFWFFFHANGYFALERKRKR